LLGVTLHTTLSVDQHVTDVVRSCSYHIRALWHIQPCLTMDAAKVIAPDLVLPALTMAMGYCWAQRRETFTDCRWLRTLLSELSVRCRIPSVRLIYAAPFTGCRYDRELTTRLPGYIQSQTDQHTSLHGIIDQ